MKLSIIVPVHNEEKTVGLVLKKLRDLKLKNYSKEIVVVDDGSTDATKEIVSRFRGKISNFKIIKHRQNIGKGAAVRSGLEYIGGDYVLVQDADLEYDPASIPSLLAKMDKNVVVFGNRGTKRYPERGFHFVIGAKILTVLFNILYSQRLNDLYTGYKLFPAGIIKKISLESNGFEFEAEVACRLIKKGIRIIEVPIYYKPRNREQGKHIGYKDFFKGFIKILRLRLGGS
jgi:glycosyltransferase involved in cell wall biosynthesis